MYMHVCMWRLALIQLHVHVCHLHVGACTCVRVKTDCGMEPLASLEHIQSKVDLCTVPFPLDATEGILQIEPEADLL